MRFQITTDNVYLYLGGKERNEFLLGLWEIRTFRYVCLHIPISPAAPRKRGELSAAHYFPHNSTGFLASLRPCSHFLLLSSWPWTGYTALIWFLQELALPCLKIFTVALFVYSSSLLIPQIHLQFPKSPGRACPVLSCEHPRGPWPMSLIHTSLRHREASPVHPRVYPLPASILQATPRYPACLPTMIIALPGRWAGFPLAPRCQEIPENLQFHSLVNLK